MIINYDSWKVYEGNSYGSGRSEKIWLRNPANGEIGLIKFSKSISSTEIISEKIASDLAHSISLECAKINIGKYNSRNGSMSYLINKFTDDVVIEGIWFIYRLYPHYDPYKLFDEEKQEYYSLEMIMNSLIPFNLQNNFLKVCVFDFLIGNTDRHQNNWAVLLSEKSLRICPLYDNSSSLCSYINESDIDSILGNDLRRFESLVNNKSKSRIRIDKNAKKEPTHLEVLEYIKDNYYSELINFINLISEKLNVLEIEGILERCDFELLTTKRKELIKTFLLKKVEMMNRVFMKG